ncbi:chloride channel protein [Litchfieldia alkalitelluris]|uniref:chloride channel protein n=1 Tax=Litchfieldia alkalitelluris TaxID=304268 RepID=UPI001F3A76AE|nr:chloride channel protein [Litchfieldia alkalitelluris]
MKSGIKGDSNFFISILKWVLLGCFIGIFIGSFTALLLLTLDFLTEKREGNSWFLYLLPLAGIFIAYIYKRFGKDSIKGNNLIMEDIQGRGKTRRRMGIIVFIGTFITHLFGGSTGREGAAVQMGGSIAETTNRIFNLNLTDRKILLMSGVSAGFGSAFGTPLTGTIFGMELYFIGKMKYEALIPCFTASFIGHYITTKWGVKYEHHVIKEVPDLTTITTFKVIILCIIFTIISILYSILRYSTEVYSKRYLKEPMLRAFVGGILIVGLVFLLGGSRDYTGRGLKMVNKAFEGDVPPFAFLGKLVFTAITMGTGFVGGEAVPLFFMGATLGNTLADFFNLPTTFLAALGMITVFAGAANTPISCFILAIELFNGKGYEYFFIACIISYIFSGRYGVWPSQQLFEPKSRMLNQANGTSLSELFKKQKTT